MLDRTAGHDEVVSPLASVGLESGSRLATESGVAEETGEVGQLIRTEVRERLGEECVEVELVGQRPRLIEPSSLGERPRLADAPGQKDRVPVGEGGHLVDDRGHLAAVERGAAPHRSPPRGGIRLADRLAQGEHRVRVRYRRVEFAAQQEPGDRPDRAGNPGERWRGVMPYGRQLVHRRRSVVPKPQRRLSGSEPDAVDDAQPGVVDFVGGVHAVQRAGQIGVGRERRQRCIAGAAQHVGERRHVVERPSHRFGRVGQRRAAVVLVAE